MREQKQRKFCRHTGRRSILLISSLASSQHLQLSKLTFRYHLRNRTSQQHLDSRDFTGHQWHNLVISTRSTYPNLRRHNLHPSSKCKSRIKALGSTLLYGWMTETVFLRICPVGRRCDNISKSSASLTRKFFFDTRRPKYLARSLSQYCEDQARMYHH